MERRDLEPHFNYELQYLWEYGDNGKYHGPKKEDLPIVVKGTPAEALSTPDMRALGLKVNMPGPIALGNTDVGTVVSETHLQTCDLDEVQEKSARALTRRVNW